MNIIDAWKAAKVGQTITRGFGHIEITKRESDLHFPGETHSLIDELVRNDGSPGTRMFDCHVLAYDWEVVKIPKKIAFPLKELRHFQQGLIPGDAQVTIEWEE